METLKKWWIDFEEKHPKASKWVREGGLFFIFSNLVTVIQYIIYAFLPNLLGLGLAGMEWSWPAIPARLFGIDFTWNAIGYDVLYDAAGKCVGTWFDSYCGKASSMAEYNNMDQWGRPYYILPDAAYNRLLSLPTGVAFTKKTEAASRSH